MAPRCGRLLSCCMHAITVQQLVSKFSLLPHPEGGYYKNLPICGINTEAFPASRFTGSRIFNRHLFLLEFREPRSAFHRIQSDECWHFYAGGPLLVFCYSRNWRMGNNKTEVMTWLSEECFNTWFLRVAGLPANLQQKRSTSWAVPVAPGSTLQF